MRVGAAVAAGVPAGVLRGPRWRRLLPGVAIGSDVPLDYRTWCEAAALVLPAGGVLAEWTAAFLWGAAEPPRSGRVAVAVPPDRRLTAHARLAVRHSPVPEADRATCAGLPVTTPLRTAFDLARRLPLGDAVATLDTFTHRALVSLPALAAYAAARAGWPGLPGLRAALALAEPLAESPMETRLRLLLCQAGLPRPVAQHEVRHGALRTRLDLAYPDRRLGLEYDGGHRRDRATSARDLRRAHALHLAGWTLLRFTAPDLLARPARTLATVRAALLADPATGPPGAACADDPAVRIPAEPRPRPRVTPREAGAAPRYQTRPARRPPRRGIIGRNTPKRSVCHPSGGWSYGDCGVLTVLWGKRLKEKIGYLGPCS
ncbi:hypothetical protein GCM10010124_05330 [Pilimelia terevasa]|uniref:DUF559 domain-containing protein n=1 Tax=Pilimelia terevasa TaxID=53372 RepID=A0A8J3BEH9_9ACTN|nr:hypothetical protein GCM10010124_05330 [Pilimelia terevasa]